MRRSMKWVAIAVPAVAIVVVIIILVSISGSNKTANNQMSDALWSAYLKQDWLSEGRSITDPSGSITTSEGQGYTLLRAVWQNDQSVFAQTWNWTRDNLQLGDGLFAWQWGKNANGSYGVIKADNGQNTAADADSDIALALIMAGHRWHNSSYLDAGSAVIKAIWQTEVVNINGEYYLAADNLEKTASTPYIVVNPSYFAPYAYRVFSAIDPTDNWIALANDSFKEINAMSQAKLGSSTSDGLPPDWVIVNRKSGAISKAPQSNLSTNFGFNAFRTIWRIGLDYQWNHTAAALATLKRFSFLDQQWNQHKQLYAIYAHDGQPVADYSSYALYGGTLPYFQYVHKSQANQIINREIRPLFKNGVLKVKLNYYDNNWLWFGLMQYNHQLTNLYGRD